MAKVQIPVLRQACRSRSCRRRFFGPAPTPSLQYLKYLVFTGPKYDYDQEPEFQKWPAPATLLIGTWQGVPGFAERKYFNDQVVSYLCINGET